MIYRILFLLVLVSAHAGAEQPFWPDVQYDPSIPSLKKVVGHKFGENISSPHQVVEYLEALAAAAPSRVKLVQYATSWNGRPLIYAVVSNAKNMAQLGDNQQNMQKLVDPRRYASSERKQLIESTLPVSWMAYGVHGDEISSTDAALLTLYHLLAAQADETVDEILAKSIVVIDPSQNPDGRARFVAHFEQNLGMEPAVHYLAAEHRQPWPRGRSNHYLFDMNRDWFALTQPETRGRIEHFLKYFPVVHADIHEMGVNQTYYFPPPADPYNPHLSQQQKDNLILYGRGNASAFDDFNFDYFVREVFDAHYAGYGDTWPAFHGAIGMTFEMASARGLVQRRDNGELVTYRSGVHHHFVASMGTLLTTARHGEKLLTDFADYRAKALEADQHYTFKGDVSLQQKLMTNLVHQGIEVHRLQEATRVCGVSKPAGSFVVRAGQPAGHLVRTLLDADSPIEPEFWKEKERKRDLGLPVDMYDVLAWSLPALYGLETSVCQKSIDGLTLYTPQASEPRQYDNAEFGYLIENQTSASVAFLAATLRADIEVHNVGGAFSASGRKYRSGTLLIKSSGLDEAQHQIVHGLANQHDVELIGLSSSWTTSGISFGSDLVDGLKAPNIALAWDSPTYATGAGSARFVIERVLGYPLTTVRTPYLASRQIDYFDVIILPDGGDYAEEIGATGVARLKEWVAQGGVLITLGDATRMLIQDTVNLLDSQLEANLESVEDKQHQGRAPASTIDSEDEYLALLAESATQPDYVPGVIARGKSNQDHYLAAGVAETLYMIVSGQDVYTPLKQGAGVNVVHFAEESELLHGGYLWQENKAQLAFKPAVMARDYGEGAVIGFVVDPTFRGLMDGFHVMLGNALFKTPSR